MGEFALPENNPVCVVGQPLLAVLFFPADLGYPPLCVPLHFTGKNRTARSDCPTADLAFRLSANILCE